METSIYDILYLDSYDDAAASHCLAQMPIPQQEAIAKIANPRRRKEKVAAYDLLVQMLQSNGLWHDAPILAYGAHGKPYLSNYPDLHFNISHCRNAVAVAIDTSGAIGIDIEGRRKIGESLMRYVCSDSELREIRQAADPELSFIRLWTRKEALLKQRGTGIRGNMQEILNPAATARLNIDSQYLPEIDGYVSVCHTAAK